MRDLLVVKSNNAMLAIAKEVITELWLGYRVGNSRRGETQALSSGVKRGMVSCGE